MPKKQQPKKASARGTKKAPVKEAKQQPKKAGGAKKTSTEAVEKAKLTTKEILEREEKVNFYIPLESGEKAGAVETVTINGYRTVVKKGVMQMLPKSVVAMLAEHYKISAEAGKEMRADRDEATLEALSE